VPSKRSKLKQKPKQDTSTRLNFEAIGTAWTIDIYEPIVPGLVEKLQAAILKRIDAFDKDYSRFRSDSLVTRMAMAAGDYELPSDAEPLFDLYKSLYDLTDGMMTPLIGQVLADAGYDANYSLVPKELTTPPSWDVALDYKFPQLTMKQPALLDLGAAGKGYLVDIISSLLVEHGVQSFCVNAGGDMCYRTETAEPLKVGLENPDDLAQVIGIASIHNQSICGSSGNRRSWADFHHIINPKTLSSPQHIQALWIVAETCLLADALATALFFIPANILSTRYTFEYAVLHQDAQLEYSPNFPAEFFIV
jgi:thiamine biosynthesis lipoprotein